MQRTILVPDTLVQAACIAVLACWRSRTARPLRAALLRQSDRLPPSPMRPVAWALARAGPSILLLLLVWFARLAFNAAGSRADLLRLAESLVLVWVLIRLSSRLVRNEALARAIAVAAWVIAALNIAGLIGPVVNLMDAMAVPIGNFRLSLLLLLKGAITLAVLIWLANTAARLVEHRLDRLSGMAPAMRVLAGKLTRLVLVVLAVVLALGSIGIDLTAFAVFSGAIGVGVGFGLQKVVSNLVSGVILLLDRSIKPGDVIEIDGTYGFVNALNARYAAVTTRDGKEFLIPNEDLITQRVTNWSYSNDLIRLHVKIGISYQSDPHKAIELAWKRRARYRACWRAGAELPVDGVRRQFGRSGIAFLDQRSGERHRQCAQRGHAADLGPVTMPTTSNCRSRSATSRCAIPRRWRLLCSQSAVTNGEGGRKLATGNRDCEIRCSSVSAAPHPPVTAGLVPAIYAV